MLCHTPLHKPCTPLHRVCTCRSRNRNRASQSWRTSGTSRHSLSPSVWSFDLLLHSSPAPRSVFGTVDKLRRIPAFVLRLLGSSSESASRHVVPVPGTPYQGFFGIFLFSNGASQLKPDRHARLARSANKQMFWRRGGRSRTIRKEFCGPMPFHLATAPFCFLIVRRGEPV
jgi:hypothetical protein